MKSVKKLKEDIKKVEQVILEGKEDLDKRKDYDEAMKFLSEIGNLLKTLRDSDS